MWLFNIILYFQLKCFVGTCRIKAKLRLFMLMCRGWIHLCSTLHDVVKITLDAIRSPEGTFCVWLCVYNYTMYIYILTNFLIIIRDQSLCMHVLLDTVGPPVQDGSFVHVMHGWIRFTPIGGASHVYCSVPVTWVLFSLTCFSGILFQAWHSGKRRPLVLKQR